MEFLRKTQEKIIKKSEAATENVSSFWIYASQIMQVYEVMKNVKRLWSRLLMKKKFV